MSNLSFLQRFSHWLSADPSTESAGLLFLKRSLNLLYALFQDLKEQQLTFRAMGLAYTTLLSLVPLLALSFSVLKAFGVHNQIEPLLLSLMEPLGEKGIEITDTLLSFVDNVKVGILGTLGLAMLFYTVISLMQKIEDAFNYTWRVSESRNFSERFSHYLSVLLVGPVLMFSAIGLSASLMNHEFVLYMTSIQPLGDIMHWTARQIPRVMIILAFAFVYIYVPNTRVKLHAALIGAVTAGLLWQATGWAFAAFVVNSAKNTAIYSAFASLLFFMLWMYIGWLILLVGASIAFYVQYPEQSRFRQSCLQVDNRVREQLALLIVSLIGQKFYTDSGAYSLSDLRTQLGVPRHVLQLVLDKLCRADLLLITETQQKAYIPAKSWEKVPLYEVLAAVRQAEQGNVFVSKVAFSEPVDRVLKQTERAMKTELEPIMLADFVQQKS